MLLLFYSILALLFEIFMSDQLDTKQYFRLVQNESTFIKQNKVCSCNTVHAHRLDCP